MSTEHPAPISPQWEALGLFDPREPSSSDRQALLAFYETQGLEPAVFADVDPEEVSRVANLHSIRRGRRLDARTACEASGLDWELFEQLAQVTGYPLQGEHFTEADVAIFKLFDVAATLFSVDEMVHFSAVMGSSLGRIADAASALFRIDVSPSIEAAGGSDLDYARKNFEAAELVRLMDQPLWALFAMQLELAGARGDESRSGIDPDSDAHLVNMGVGFVDLVGFTPLAVETPVGELARFIRQFEQEAMSIVGSHGGRLVKLIGDEVMFVAVDVDATVQIATSLMEAVVNQGVQPHGGVAHGKVIARGGDYYGRIVNLASRIAALAVPGELLVDAETAAQSTAHAFEPAGRRQIKGFPEPVRLSSLLT